jgi:predicted RNA-binding Zn-ribbon protein involved in translation (DUF1610 family)
MNPQAARILLLKEYLGKGRCPNCRRATLTTTLTLDGGRLYRCTRCGFKLTVSKEMTEEVENCPEG